VKTGKLSAFLQELMLRITSDEERLVLDSEIRWYSRSTLLQNPGVYNYYITTDFATSGKQKSDYSVIFVWAYNANGDWFWVDGVVKRQTMDKNIDDLFRLSQKYKPQTVGIEVTGQQNAFIQWLQREMLLRNVWFNFASSSKSGDPGIRPVTDKLSRFNIVVPWFKAGKMYFPEELKLNNSVMAMIMEQLRLATQSGLKGKNDDCIDGISMLGYLNPWKPSESALAGSDETSIWDEDHVPDNTTALTSYIV